MSGLRSTRAARICAAGHGGQVLVSHTSVALLEDEEHALLEVEFRDLGEQELKDFHRPVRLYQVVGAAPRRRVPAASDLFEDCPRPSTGRSGLRCRPRSEPCWLCENTARPAASPWRSSRSERSDAYAARTFEELEAIGRDLPRSTSVEQRRRPKRVTVAVLSNTVRTGRWRPPRFGFAFVFLGDADLDLRQTELEHRVTTITAIVLLGNVDVYVPEGIEVDFGGLGIFGHRREFGRRTCRVFRERRSYAYGFFAARHGRSLARPGSLVGRPFREVINALRRGRRRSYLRPRAAAIPNCAAALRRRS